MMSLAAKLNLTSRDPVAIEQGDGGVQLEPTVAPGVSSTLQLWLTDTFDAEPSARIRPEIRPDPISSSPAPEADHALGVALAQWKLPLVAGGWMPTSPQPRDETISLATLKLSESPSALHLSDIAAPGTRLPLPDLPSIPSLPPPPELNAEHTQGVPRPPGLMQLSPGQIQSASYGGRGASGGGLGGGLSGGAGDGVAMRDYSSRHTLASAGQADGFVTSAPAELRGACGASDESQLPHIDDTLPATAKPAADTVVKVCGLSRLTAPTFGSVRMARYGRILSLCVERDPALQLKDSSRRRGFGSRFGATERNGCWLYVTYATAAEAEHAILSVDNSTAVRA